MNGSRIKIVIDTNIIFMAWYNPLGKCAEVLRKAKEGRLELFSPDSVKEEITRIFRKHNLTDKEIDEFINEIPVTWINKEIYMKVIKQTKIKHKADKPVEAVSLILNCKVLSADKHFKGRIDVNKLLEKLE